MGREKRREQQVIERVSSKAFKNNGEESIKAFKKFMIPIIYLLLLYQMQSISCLNSLKSHYFLV